MAPLPSPAAGPMSSATAETYQSNTALYQDPNLVETVDHAPLAAARAGRRRGCAATARSSDHDHRPARRRDRTRHLPAVPDGRRRPPGDPGGAPAPGSPTTTGCCRAAAVRNGVLHITSAHCDDDVITSRCAGGAERAGPARLLHRGGGA